MITDFHTHSFPDKIAAKSMAFLVSAGGLQPYRDGTLGSLKQTMKTDGIDRSVVLPVATSAKQERTINELSKQLNGQDGIFFAGAVHPDCGDVEGTLDFIKDAGLFGIKLHPDYQGVDFDDERYVNIIEQAVRRGLYVITHAGVDVAFRDHVHCTPDMILSVLSELGGVIEDKLILAHLGGYEMPDEALEKLAGKPVYMDTAAVLKLYPEKCRRIIKKHTPDKILFASDSPWDSPGDFVSIIRSFGFSPGDEEKIFNGNAQRILGTAV